MNTKPPLLKKSTRAWPSRRVQAFSLIELLAVIAVMSALLVVAGGALRGPATGPGVQGAVSLGAGLVNFARSNAVIRKEGARVLVDMDPASDGYLRRVAVVRGVRDGAGNRLWVLASRPQMLPEGVFFDPENSNGYETMSFNLSSGDEQAGDAGAPVAFFEYDGSGRLQLDTGSGLARMIFVAGIMDNSSGTREFSVPESRVAGMSGFILRRAGNVTYYESVEQILN